MSERLIIRYVPSPKIAAEINRLRPYYKTRTNVVEALLNKALEVRA